MALIITDELYNGDSNLQANAGDWVDGVVKFTTQFQKGSGFTNTITYNSIGNIHSLTAQQGTWGERGFLDGDTVTITWNYLGNGPPALINQSHVKVVDYIDNNIMYLTTALIWAPAFTVEVVDGRVFPTENFVNGMSVIADKLPNAMEFYFNLTPNGGTTLNSVIDGGIQRFGAQDVDTLIAGGTTPMVALGDRSGGYVTDVVLEYDADAGGGYRDFIITYKFWQWGVIKDGFPVDNPPYYDLADHLAPIVRMIAFAEYQNPNAVLDEKSTNTEGNTGGFDENYNGAVNNYTAVSIQWEDVLTNPIDALDYSGDSTFFGVIDALNQDAIQSVYNIGLVWRPLNGTYYQQVAPPIVNNLMVIAPEVDFLGDGTIDATVYQGFPIIAPGQPYDGARWDMTDIQFTIVGATVEVRGKIIPNAAAAVLFAGVPTDGRKSTIWVSIANYNLTGSAADRVSLKLFDEDNIDAPTLGVQIPNVQSEILLDHGFNDITTPLPQTTTEDDVYYKSEVLFVDNVEYQGVRTRIFAFNTVTDEEFTLEDQFFSFQNVVEIAGQFQPNEIVNRGFNLPPATDRNIISVTRDPLLDVPGFYGIVITYGWLNDWRYWLEESDVNNDFFDINEFAFSGKNKNWQRFSNSGDWILRLAYYTRVDGVDDFNYFEVGDRDYEDEDVTTTWDYTVISTGATPNDLVADEEHSVLATLLWNVGIYQDVWAEVTIEDYESGNRWVISSILGQGGVVPNPLKPIVGQTMLDLTFPSPDTAELRLIVDTNVVTANKVCLSARIRSLDDITPPYVYPILNGDEFHLAYSVKYKLSPNTVYAGPPIQVMRDFDSAVLDIPFNNVMLDEVILLDFVTVNGAFPSGEGRVSIFYNQSGILNHAQQGTWANMVRVVKSGVIDVGANGYIAGIADGVDDSYVLDTPVVTAQVYQSFFVCDRPTSSNLSVALGAAIPLFPFDLIWSVIGRVTNGMGAVAQNHGTVLTTGNIVVAQIRDGVNNLTYRTNSTPLPTLVQAPIGGSWNTLLQRNVAFHDGPFQEYMMAFNNLNHVATESNIKTRYNIP